MTSDSQSRKERLLEALSIARAHNNPYLEYNILETMRKEGIEEVRKQFMDLPN